MAFISFFLFLFKKKKQNPESAPNRLCFLFGSVSEQKHLWSFVTCGGVAFISSCLNMFPLLKRSHKYSGVQHSCSGIPVLPRFCIFILQSISLLNIVAASFALFHIIFVSSFRDKNTPTPATCAVYGVIRWDLSLSCQEKSETALIKPMN